jgi:hypothetical protein
MDDAINLAMFEFAFTIKALLNRGWDLVEIDYGERRLSISPKLIVKKANQIVECRSITDIERLLEKECDNEVITR